MKSTGMVRKVDDLGRIVIPKEMRRTLEIEERDSVEIYSEEDAIVLKKFKPSNQCEITGKVSSSNVSLVNGKLVLSREGIEILINELQEKKVVTIK